MMLDNLEPNVDGEKCDRKRINNKGGMVFKFRDGVLIALDGNVMAYCDKMFEAFHTINRHFEGMEMKGLYTLEISMKNCLEKRILYINDTCDISVKQSLLQELSMVYFYFMRVYHLITNRLGDGDFNKEMFANEIWSASKNGRLDNVNAPFLQYMNLLTNELERCVLTNKFNK